MRLVGDSYEVWTKHKTDRRFLMFLYVYISKIFSFRRVPLKGRKGKRPYMAYMFVTQDTVVHITWVNFRERYHELYIGTNETVRFKRFNKGCP